MRVNLCSLLNRLHIILWFIVSGKNKVLGTGALGFFKRGKGEEKYSKDYLNNSLFPYLSPLPLL